MSTIEKQIEDAEEVLKQLHIKLKHARANKSFVCVVCNGKHKIKDCVGVQTHWYVNPYSCSSGDYWEEGEMYIVCPTTPGVANRVLFSNIGVPHEKRKQYIWDVESQFKLIYSSLFKEMINTHRENPYRTINTDYFDNNRKKFGLNTPNDNKSEESINE